MAEPIHLRTTPLDRLLPWALPEDALTLDELRFAQQIGVRLRGRVPAYLAGLPLPLEPNRTTSMRAVRVSWLGPDEWLITAPEGTVPELPTRVARALADRRAAVTDLSASRAIIEIAGPRACELLQKGCGLDLHPRAFEPGQCAQTLLARLPVIIDQLTAAPAYRVYVRRSSAQWLCEWLIDAADEFRLA
ncbi:MAG TPA: sarcosine oxidase subunit gamma family protein [Stellaceae bacterium]